jgi:TonB family protein
MTTFALAFTALALTDVSAAVKQPDAQACPNPIQQVPRYPVEAVRRDIGGEAIVAGRFDDCGRVTEVVIRKKSGNKFIDAEAVNNLKRTILSESQRSRAVDGYYEMTISFGVEKNLRYEQLDWPKTHKNPVYELDESAIGFDSVESASKAIRETDENIIRPPVYPFAHRIVQFDAPTGREFWLFINSKGTASVAARYRPVMDNGKPIVKMRMLCELQQKQCDDVRALLLKDLPMSPAKR